MKPKSTRSICKHPTSGPRTTKNESIPKKCKLYITFHSNIFNQTPHATLHPPVFYSMFSMFSIPCFLFHVFYVFYSMFSIPCFLFHLAWATEQTGNIQLNRQDPSTMNTLNTEPYTTMQLPHSHRTLTLSHRTLTLSHRTLTLSFHRTLTLSFLLK